MKQPPTPIIAFFARGGGIGFALLDGGELRRYGVKTIEGRRRGAAFTRSIENALSPLLAMLGEGGLIVMERNSPASRRGALCRRMSQIANRWERRGYAVCPLSLSEAKRRMCERPKATHRVLVETIATRHPILRPLVTRASIQQFKYWERVFIAMALAEVANERLGSFDRPGRRRK